jgi:hypothetical protein
VIPDADLYFKNKVIDLIETVNSNKIPIYVRLGEDPILQRNGEIYYLVFALSYCLTI